MKRMVPWLLVWGALICAFYDPYHVKPLTAVDSGDFGRLPVLANGRIKPFDTLARTSLLIIHGKRVWKDGKGIYHGATDWLMQVVMRPELADEHKIFLIHNAEVLGLMGWEQKSGEKYFSFKDLSSYLDTIQKQAQLASEVESAHRTLFQKEISKLYQNLLLYHRLKNSLHTDEATEFNKEITVFRNSIEPGVEAFRKKQAGAAYSKEALELLGQFTERYNYIAKNAYFRPIPPMGAAAEDRKHWISTGEALLDFASGKPLSPVVGYFALMDEAYGNGEARALSSTAIACRNALEASNPSEVRNIDFECFFNQVDPFYRCMVLYVFVFILTWISWLKWSEVLGRGAYFLLLIALGLHTWGVFSRVYVQGYAPVTNLYSSAVFIGWAVVVLGIILERIYRNGIGSLTSSALGFITLLIADYLALEGDTMEMMRAVLDSNFWLSTHVVAVTLGYAATFFAGFLALIYFFRGCFSSSMDQKTGDHLTSMVYAIVCFATLFSLVGTILGGIWADQSWGRFWGWDPKENGALLIVIWNAMILHARWGGFIKQKGLMSMAIFGNIVTSFSWFGVNMLGVGLHSYGFMDKAFLWLALFWGTQILCMALLGVLPVRISPERKSSPLR